MKTDEYRSMAGQNFTCPKCRETIVFELKDEGKPIICKKCGTDITNDSAVQAAIQALKAMGPVFCQGK